MISDWDIWVSRDENERNINSPSNVSVAHSDYLCWCYIYLKM